MSCFDLTHAPVATAARAAATGPVSMSTRAGPLLRPAATFTEYHAPVVFTLLSYYVHRFCSSHHSNCLSDETCPGPILVLVYMDGSFYAQFCLILFTVICNNIMHILPLPLCGLYSIRAQSC